jgi:hypothetical protein
MGGGMRAYTKTHSASYTCGIRRQVLKSFLFKTLIKHVERMKKNRLSIFGLHYNPTGKRKK